MLLGCVVRNPAEVAQAAGLPVDYLELKGDMLCVDDDEFVAMRTRLQATGLPCLAMTSPLPRRFQCRVVGPDADAERALAVFNDMCDRGGSLGVRTVVLGSGQARNVPPGFSPEVARGQFLDFVTAAARHCAAREQRLTLEPLNSTETNFVNSCAQARPVVDELAGVGIAVDCYHVVSEGLSVSVEVAAAAGAIGHAHTSSLPRGTGDFQPAVQAEFVAELRAAGHTGGLTIEDAFADFGREAADAALLFRRILTAEAVRS